MKDMEPNRGKGLALLRSLNSLLRRTSKTGEGARFCGRIIIFMNSVYPFGERSGVNLRGEYGPEWTSVEQPLPSDGMEGIEVAADDSKKETMVDDQSEPPTLEESSNVRFYNTFWALQEYFARPHTFRSKEAMATFKKVVESVLPSLSASSRKEKEGTGNSRQAAGPSSRATLHDDAKDMSQDYFFAKFLTSPDLLEFEASPFPVIEIQTLTLLSTARRPSLQAANIRAAYDPSPIPKSVDAHRKENMVNQNDFTAARVGC